MTGATDREIFEYAVKNDMVLFTFDNDFRQILYRPDITNSAGVVIERINQMEKQEMIDIIVAFFSENRDIKGKLILIGKTNIIIRAID